jgi:hypothetical protein
VWVAIFFTRGLRRKGLEEKKRKRKKGESEESGFEFEKFDDPGFLGVEGEINCIITVK